jgi:hypothetical protein
MRISYQIAFRSISSASLLLLIPAIASAGATTPASPKPRPDRITVKVWTNEDLEALRPQVEPANEPAPPNTEPPAEIVTLRSPDVLPPEKDPRWYAQQLATLDSELSRVTSEEDELLHFRETSTGLPTGLNVVSPCKGITTDNRIAQLEGRRDEILQELDTLADTARVNDMPPGILVEGRGLVTPEPPPTPQQQEDALIARYQNLAGQLEETQVTLDAMQEDADAHHEPLLQPDPGWGGNLTTNLLQDLYQQQSSLESQLDATQDELRHTRITVQ